MTHYQQLRLWAANDLRRYRQDLRNVADSTRRGDTGYAVFWARMAALDYSGYVKWKARAAEEAAA